MESDTTPPEPESPPPAQGRIRCAVDAARAALTPGPLVRKGLVLGALIFTAIVAMTAGAILEPGVHPIADPFLGMGAGLVIALVLCGVAMLAIKVVASLPRILPWPVVGAAAAVAIIFLMLPAMSDLAPVYAAGVVLMQAFFGAAILIARRHGLRVLHPFKRAVVGLVLVLGAVVNLYIIGWVLYPGSTRHLTEARPDAAVTAIALPNPADPGPHAIAMRHYGSGTDQRRAEFGPGVEVTTPVVDASPYTDAHWIQKRLRTWYWGFDRDAFPLNARVWHPESGGPYPLVLIVHGNNRMEDFSDPGYEWIGTHLASRGFVAVSVDQNFLNVSFHGNWRRENDARAWLLLKHLEQWRQWNADPEHPLHGIADLERVALVGHSRGGEAAAIAAAFNRLAHYPDDARKTFDFGFGIQAVIAIAPTDGQYRPAGLPTPLEDIHYLVMSGGHDADVAAYLGKRQYDRVRFTGEDGGFKASVYAYRANHGQFNTRWGRHDAPFPISRMLNTRPLLSGDDQRRIGTVYFTAFLEAALHGEDGYRALFQDHRAAAEWLPEDLYATRYEDSRFQPIARFDEDIDLTTTTLPGGRIEGEGLTVWREQILPYRAGGLTTENSVAVIGWNHEGLEGEPPSYSVHLPENTNELRMGPDASLSFALAESREQAPAHGEDAGNGHAKRASLDFTVELIDADGNAAALPLSRFRAVQPPLIARFTKLWSEEYIAGAGWEASLQTFLLPLAEFAHESAAFEPERLQTIRFRFDLTEEGLVILDDIGVQG